ncbi:MAG: AAA family ATPase, partial [Gemmatimonadota bacterium]|nr:AAA family ATPase [Gemmatimonadota bacterium]
TLLGLGLADAAVAEFRAALALGPDVAGLKLGLARAFHAAGKTSEALVVIEDLVGARSAPARAFVVHARILAGIGEVEQAARQYRRGVGEDPEAADPELARRLGIRERSDPADASASFDPDHYGDEVVGGRVRAAWEGPDEPPFTEIERPTITFDDVGGMDDVKEEIRLKVIYPLAHPEMYAAYGKKAGGGILMYGPPGCGKTHLARATAGEVDASFIAVGIHDVLDMWIGNSERNLHELFEIARGNAPCVLFFDEVDALGASRADMKSSAGRHLINQFLSELDGIHSDNEGVLVLGATNAPWHLDSAFRRPGRFDRVVFVPPPDAGARAAILRLLMRGKPQDDVDVEAVAKKCSDFSGADLRAVVEMTVEGKLTEAIRTGTPGPIRTKDLLAALSAQKPTTREWFATAKNYALYSNQGGAYDEILKYLNI